MVIESAGWQSLTGALLPMAAMGHAPAVNVLLDHGADVNMKGPAGNPAVTGRTPLMLAAASERLPLDTITALLDRGQTFRQGPIASRARPDVSPVRSPV